MNDTFFAFTKIMNRDGKIKLEKTKKKKQAKMSNKPREMRNRYKVAAYLYGEVHRPRIL